MSVADQFIEEGRKEGLREGLREGSQRMLLNLLRARFGEVPREAADRVAVADLAEIDTWTVRVLTAPTLDAVLRDP